MFIFFLIILLLIPATMIGFGLFWRKNPPKTINWVYGYRTSWSMKSQETWDFAHKYVGTIWLYTGILLCLISVMTLIVFRNCSPTVLEGIILIITAVQLVGLFLPIVPTEIVLKKRFDKNGNRK
jgi:uncharacterized membrane protein